MLEMGGNAADAAVAAAFSIAVVEPSMNSIGGRNQILVRLPNGDVLGIDGTTQAPWDYDYDTAPQAGYGYPVIGVPGAVAGLLKLHSEHGSLPLETVMQPAIDYAERGFRLLPGEALRHLAAATQLAEFPGSREAYLDPEGLAYRAGDLLVQPDYAATLRAIVEGGHDAFYRGPIAERMAEDLRANGSALALNAFAEYEALPARVVRGFYRGYELVGLDVPAAGIVSIQALQIMEHFDPDAMSDAEWAAVTGQALAIASRELPGLGTDTAAARALSQEWAGEMALEITLPAHAASAGSPVGDPADDPASTTRYRAVPDADPSVASTRVARPPSLPERHDDRGHTTHLTTADVNGMQVVLTQTLGPNMGSKVVTPGLGFLYASTLGGYLGRMEPGERARSFISPIVVLDDGEPFLALGAAGGARIVSGVVQVVSRMIDGGMTLAEALEAPRVHRDRSGRLDAETSPVIGWSEGELQDMRALGLDVASVARAGAFSRVHAIHFDRVTSTWHGVADPDWEGSARGPVPPGE